MRISDWSSDVCSSDLAGQTPVSQFSRNSNGNIDMEGFDWTMDYRKTFKRPQQELTASAQYSRGMRGNGYDLFQTNNAGEVNLREKSHNDNLNKETTFQIDYVRSEEHTSELQSLM